jgi:uncharacterized membrane protein YeaQ/YmgE (transglycosylase-associated protein family)
MYFLAWIIIGLITGWLTGKLLGGGGYGPIVGMVMGIAGAIGGGIFIRLARSATHGGLAYTSLAAILGAALVAGINAHFSARERYA